jgi:hypothetical protein
MIVWLASYPKSGNTLLRSILSTYFYSSDGIYDFNYTYLIEQFPTRKHFEKFGIDSTNEQLVFKNFIKVQEMINSENKKIKFLKTHSQYFHNGDFKFTNGQNSLCAIYIVRDPRNVVTSFSKFKSLTVEKTADFMINGTGDGLVWTNNWSVNYQSWKIFKEYERYLLIKYEDLISKPDKTFLKILEYIHKLNKTNFVLDKKKFENVVKTTSFENMQNLEKEKGFSESWVDEKTGKKIPFFYLGPKNDWRNKLDTKIVEKLEKAFKLEMEELAYL